MTPPAVVQMTPERASSLGLPPCRFALDATGAGFMVSQRPGSYASLGGPPGGTMLIELLPCAVRDEASLTRWLRERLPGPPESVGPVASVPFAHGSHPSVCAVFGQSLARSLWCALFLYDPTHAPSGLAILAAVSLGPSQPADLDVLLASPFVGGVLRTFALGDRPLGAFVPPPPPPPPPVLLSPPLSSPFDLPAPMPFFPTNPPPVMAPLRAPPEPARVEVVRLPRVLYLEEVDARPPAHHRVRDGATVGRAAHNDLRLAAPSVSREHAALVFNGATWEVRPRPGTETLLNRAPVTHAAELTEGDVLQLGQQSLKVTLRAPAEVLAPPALVAAFAGRGWAVPFAPVGVAGRLEDRGSLHFATSGDATEHLAVQVDGADGGAPSCRYQLRCANADIALVVPMDDAARGVFAALRSLLTAIHHAARRRVLSPSDVIRFECDEPGGRGRWRTHHNVVGGGPLLDALADAAAHVSAH